MEKKLLQYPAEKLTSKDVPFFIGIFALGLFLFLFYTWAMPLIDPDEPRYASTARDMVLNGNWIVPHFNGAPRINKPPLFYWTIAISYKLFGINELSARLPSALAAIGTAIITYLWGKRAEGRSSGFWAGVILMASPLFFFIARFCITDMLLTFLISASLYLFFTEYSATNKNNMRRLFLYFLLSMVFLVKGPVGILLFILITLGFLLWMRDFQQIRRLWYLPGFLLFVGIICLWGIPFWLTLGTKQVFSLLSQETSGRFVSGYAHPEPFYYYFPVFIIGFFPWSVFAFITIIYIFKNRKNIPVGEKKQIYFFCSWLIFTLVFFSLSQSKLPTYILPLSPAIVLLILPLSRWEREGRSGRELPWILWFTLGLSIVAPVVLLLTLSKWVPANYGFSTTGVAIPIIIFFVGMLTALFTFIQGRRFSRLQKVFCCTSCILLVVTVAYLAKHLGISRSTKDIVEKCHLREKENYILISSSRTIQSLVFYSGKNVVEMGDDTPFIEFTSGQGKAIYVVMSLRDFQKKTQWIQEKNLHPLCRNDVHIILQRGSN